MLRVLFILSCFGSFSDAYRSQNTYEKAIINAQGITSFWACQKKAKLINTALKLNLTLDNVPSRPISQENVTFWLYTRKNPREPESLNVFSSQKMITSSKYFNETLPTVLYVHGYSQFWNESAQILTTKLLPKENINLVIVDWDSYSFFSLDYTRNNTTPRLGAIVAKFGNQLMKRRVIAKEIHFIGYSVGGQVVGLAGKEIRPKVGKILAIDPQGNCFNYLPESQRLSRNDAEFVQIIHCTVGEKAIPLHHLGHLTFYMNGGLLQPNCTSSTAAKMSLCSHLICDDYFFDSLSNVNSYIGVKCDNQLQYLFNECNNNDVSVMGYNALTSARGTYYVDTESPNQFYN